MPRKARTKSPAAIYHIMIRGISEVALFSDSEDKERYLLTIKKYQSLYLFNIYAYCLMTTHAHFIIDSNGADISHIMKSINQSYGMYYNHKYNRHGHLFQDRFKSKLVENENYLLTLSAYIHNNPKDIDQYKNDISKYPYSSLPVYLGISQDLFKILNYSVILNHFSTNKIRARKSYIEFLDRVSSSEYDYNLYNDIEFSKTDCQYISGRSLLIRTLSPQDIFNFLIHNKNYNFNPYIKYNHRNNEIKAIYIILMRSLCNLSIKEIGSIIGNSTLSNISRLSSKGIQLIETNHSYKALYDELLQLTKTKKVI